MDSINIDHVSQFQTVFLHQHDLASKLDKGGQTDAILLRLLKGLSQSASPGALMQTQISWSNSAL